MQNTPLWPSCPGSLRLGVVTLDTPIYGSNRIQLYAYAKSNYLK